MRNILIQISVIILLAGKVSGQLNLNWEQSWNGQFSRHDYGHFVNIDSEGNIIVTGITFRGDLIDYQDVIVAKFGSDGAPLWIAIHDIGWSDTPIGVYLDQSDNIYIGVTGADSSVYYPSYMLVKYDKDGNKLFANKAWLNHPDWGQNIAGRAQTLHMDNYGNFITGGIQGNFAWLLKMDYNGMVTETAAELITNDNSIMGYSTFLDKSSGEMLVGTEHYDNQNYSYFAGAANLSSEGSPEWITTLIDGGSQEPYCNGLLKTNDGFTYCAIYNVIWQQDEQQFQSDQHIFKLDPDGEVLWDVVLEAEIGDEFISKINDMDLDSGGNLVITGEINSKFFTAKYSSAGQRFLLVQDDDVLVSGSTLIPDSGGEFYVAAWDEQFSICLLKYDALGNEKARLKFDSLNPIYPWYINDMVFDEDGNLIFTGAEYNSSSEYDLVVASINDLSTSIEEDIPVSGFSLSQNYPNPFNPATTILFNLPVSSNITMTIYDILGKKVYELANEFRNSGSNTIELNTKEVNMSSGVYFYSLIIPGYQSTKKMILLK